MIRILVRLDGSPAAEHLLNFMRLQLLIRPFFAEPSYYRE